MQHSRTLLINLSIAVGAILLTLVLIEATLRIIQESPSDDGVPSHVLCSPCPQLYVANPKDPEISSQGLRDREIAIPKPQGITRIVVIGDSVAWGVNVHATDTFPKQLEKLLGKGTEVVNAAVNGYTAYNQLHFYREELNQLEPDLVIVAFNLNDVADPSLHWNYTTESISEIPSAAIPNQRYHETHIIPILESRKSDSLLEQTRLGQEVTKTINVTNITDQSGSYTTVGGHRWPTYITGEDTISIEVLTNRTSPEWQWLENIFDELVEAVKSSGSEILILIVPVSYQLDPGYPFIPQQQLTNYCRERSINCLDLLPAFRNSASNNLYFNNLFGYTDIWHLTPDGHKLAAVELEKFLAVSRLPR